jgi:hypothetical protein
MSIFPLATTRTCGARFPDSRAHTAHCSLWHQVGPVQLYSGVITDAPRVQCGQVTVAAHFTRGAETGGACFVCKRQSRVRSRGLWRGLYVRCVVAAHHPPHTTHDPPDIQVCLACPSSLSNAYFCLGLMTSIPRSRNTYRRIFVTTRTGASADLPGVRCTMPESDHPP